MVWRQEEDEETGEGLDQPAIDRTHPENKAASTKRGFNPEKGTVDGEEDE